MKCCFCEDRIEPDITGWDKGHNAAPIVDDRCCGSCNDQIVIPVRMWEQETGKLSSLREVYKKGE
tara:strand:- start:368 stop:562 length:195 start_codon:yes stop_codon:yes gene_type:complete